MKHTETICFLKKFKQGDNIHKLISSIIWFHIPIYLYRIILDNLRVEFGFSTLSFLFLAFQCLGLCAQLIQKTVFIYSSVSSFLSLTDCSFNIYRLLLSEFLGNLLTFTPCMLLCSISVCSDSVCPDFLKEVDKLFEQQNHCKQVCRTLFKRSLRV